MMTNFIISFNYSRPESFVRRNRRGRGSPTIVRKWLCHKACHGTSNGRPDDYWKHRRRNPLQQQPYERYRERPRHANRIRRHAWSARIPTHLQQNARRSSHDDGTKTGNVRRIIYKNTIIGLQKCTSRQSHLLTGSLL